MKLLEALTKPIEKIDRERVPLLLGLLVLLLMGGIYGLQSFSSNSGPGILEGQVKVTLTADGFDPSYIVVRKGTEVIFSTDTGEDFWPASNSHPDHTALPEFDPRRPIAPDETWSFVFDKVGAWAYHDHIRAFLGGTVAVVGEDGDQLDIRRCREFSSLSENEKVNCFENFEFNVLSYMDVKNAFEALNFFYSINQDSVFDSCHNHMHIIGDVAYREYANRGSLKNLDWPQGVISMCSSGFLHGFFDHYIKETENIDSIKDVCQGIADQYDFAGEYILFNCYHGIGHGYTVGPAFGSENYGDDVAISKEAVARCDETFIEEPDKKSCFSGVFNTLAFWKGSQEYGLSIDLDAPFAVCDAQDVKMSRDTCILMQSMQIGDKFDWDPVVFLERYGSPWDDNLRKEVMGILIE